MTGFERKDMTGSLFKNERKTTDAHPDYTGKVMINGEALRISGWIKQGREGKWMSLAFSPVKSDLGPWDAHRAQDGP